MTDRAASPCTVCAARDVEQFIQLDDVPLFCNVQWPTEKDALAAERGPIDLAFCRACGHVFNTAFEPARVVYTERYENSLHFSDRFQGYAHALAERLISRYGVRGKTIVEIGCGKGEFLSLICERGGNRGVGFDPGADRKDLASAEGTSERITIIPGMLSDWPGECSGELVCCRQVLEHVRYPRDLLQSVQRAMTPAGVAYLEVPNALFTLRKEGFWDLIYEHCSYFTPPSLAAAAASAGLAVLDIYEDFGGQYLCVEASVAGDGRSEEGSERRAEDLESLAADVRSFRTRYRRRVEEWRARLEDAVSTRRRLVIWGGGSKGVTFLNALKVRRGIEYVVDVNPRKQGLFVAGTGQEIVPPEFLVDYGPDAVLVMNPIYEDEICRWLVELGIAAPLIAI